MRISVDKLGIYLLAIALLAFVGGRLFLDPPAARQAPVPELASAATDTLGMAVEKATTRDFAAKLAERREQRIAEELRRQEAAGVSAVEIEKNMRLGQRYQASLIVQRGGNAKAQVEEMAKQMPEPTAILRDVAITEEARALATSASLTVYATSPEWQTFGPDAPAIWTWIVEPRQEGVAHLRIDLWQKVRVGDEERIVPVRSWPQTVEVSVSTLQRLTMNMAETPAWTAMEAMARVGGALGLVLLVWGRARRWQATMRRRSRGGEGDTAGEPDAVADIAPPSAPKPKRKSPPRRRT